MAWYRPTGKPEEEITVTADTTQKTILPSAGKTIKKITVKPTPTQEKTVTPSTSQQTVLPDSGKHLSKVTVKAKPSIKVDGVEIDTNLNLRSKNMNVLLSTLPYTLSFSMVIEFKDEIHLLGGNNNQAKHYKWNGSVWTEVSTLPYPFYQASAAVFQEELHILGSIASKSHYKKHYKWNGSVWTEVSTLPINCTSLNKAVGGEDAIRLFIDGYVYKWNGSEWTLLLTKPQWNFNEPIRIENTIYGFNNALYKWEEEQLQFTKVSDLPSDISNVRACSRNDEIIMTSKSTAFQPIYKWNGNIKKIGELPFPYMEAIVNIKGNVNGLGADTGSPFHTKNNHWEILRKIYEEVS